MSAGCLYGVGVGPGDPELMTLKAVRILGSAHVVAYFAKSCRESNARRIAAQYIRSDVEELPMHYPVTTENPKHEPAYQALIADFYERCAGELAARLDRGRAVAVLTEGDPLLYGSYMHLHVRLAERYRTEVIPGVTGMSGCWSSAKVPIAQGDDTLVVLPATLSEAQLERRLADVDAAVVIKLGRNIGKVRRALERSGLLGRALYVERGTMSDSAILPLARKADDNAPYFSMILVPGWRRKL